MRIGTEIEYNYNGKKINAVCSDSRKDLILGNCMRVEFYSENEMLFSGLFPNVPKTLAKGMLLREIKARL